MTQLVAVSLSGFPTNQRLLSVHTPLVIANHADLSDDAVALAITVLRDRFTLPGNICIGGVIEIGGGPLPADPWRPLNIVSVV